MITGGHFLFSEISVKMVGLISSGGNFNQSNTLDNPSINLRTIDSYDVVSFADIRICLVLTCFIDSIRKGEASWL